MTALRACKENRQWLTTTADYPTKALKNKSTEKSHPKCSPPRLHYTSRGASSLHWVTYCWNETVKATSPDTKNHAESNPNKRLGSTHLANTYRTDEGQVEDGAEDRYPSDEAYYDGEEAPGPAREKKKHGCGHLLDLEVARLCARASFYLKRRKNPYTSSTTPMMGQPISTTNTPPRKKPVAFILCFWKKKRKVRSRPMTKASPATNRI